MGRIVRQGPCSQCGSSDALAHYEDGSTYCWSAYHTGRKWTKPAGAGDWKPDPLMEKYWTGSVTDINQLSAANMLARGIDASVAAAYGVRVEYDGQRNEVAYYFPVYHMDGKLLGYQRKAAKAPGLHGKGDVARVKVDGVKDWDGAVPFGSEMNKGRGKFVIVTEGGESAMAAYQMLAAEGKNYRVVATLGADGWRRSLEWFEQFESVCICYDQDEGGRQASDEFAQALSHGKARIMRWNQALGNDPNDLLINRQGKAFFSACMSAKPYEATGIVFGEEIWNRMQDYVAPEFVPYPPEYAQLAAKMGGMRMGEISLWTAGSSIGKTSFIRRIKQHTLVNCPEWRIAEAELEESGEKTWRGLMQFHAGKRWHHMSKDEQRKAYEETYGTGRIATIDNGLDAKGRKGGLLGKFRHLHYDQGTRLFFLDHITLGVREFGDKGGSLADQDQMMEEMLAFVTQTKSHMCLISHLRKPPGGGESWSTGAVPTEEDMKGSGSLYQIAFDIVAVSRNKQHVDDYQRNVSQLHVTKCRETGDTGPADRLYWNHITSTLEQARADEPSDEGAPL